jgi:hypothetical protein
LYDRGKLPRAHANGRGAPKAAIRGRLTFGLQRCKRYPYQPFIQQAHLLINGNNKTYRTGMFTHEIADRTERSAQNTLMVFYFDGDKPDVAFEDLIRIARCRSERHRESRSNIPEQVLHNVVSYLVKQNNDFKNAGYKYIRSENRTAHNQCLTGGLSYMFSSINQRAISRFPMTKLTLLGTGTPTPFRPRDGSG